jgi:hypothetical protein
MGDTGSNSPNLRYLWHNLLEGHRLNCSVYVWWYWLPLMNGARRGHQSPLGRSRPASPVSGLQAPKMGGAADGGASRAGKLVIPEQKVRPRIAPRPYRSGEGVHPSSTSVVQIFPHTESTVCRVPNFWRKKYAVENQKGAGNALISAKFPVDTICPLYVHFWGFARCPQS